MARQRPNPQQAISTTSPPARDARLGRLIEAADAVVFVILPKPLHRSAALGKSSAPSLSRS